jgi:hypothetical protein
MTTALTLHHDIDAEARIFDRDLGQRLKYKQATAIRQLISANEEELLRYGPLTTRHGKSRGQEFTAYYLNEPQALLICMKSDAPVAADIRQEVIEVYMAFRTAKLSAELGAAQEKLAMADKAATFLTVDLFRAERNERWRRSFSCVFGLYASRRAAERGIALKRQVVRYSGGIGQVNSYPRALLEEAYARCAVLLRLETGDVAKLSPTIGTAS